MATLTSLPPELHLLIFNQLSIAELLPVNAASPKLRSVTNEILSRRVQDTSTREFGFQICPPPEKNIAPFHLCFNKGPSPLFPGADVPDVYTHLIPSISHGIFGPPATKAPSENVRRTLVLEDNAFFTQLEIGLLLITFGGANGGCAFRVVFDGWFRIRREDLRSAYRRQKPLVVWVGLGQNVGLHVRVLREEVEEETETIKFETEFVQVVVRGLWMAGRLEPVRERRYVGVR